MKVLELTASPQIDARAIKLCIENDPALTAKLLRVVNSSLFGLSRQVSDLNQALGLLGVKPLKLLVLGFSLPKALFDGLEAETLAAYWRRALTKAVAAREVSNAAFGHGSDEAFIAGLLQDLGQLALVQALGEPYLAFLERARQEGGDLAARELSALGFDHAMFSARLLDHWGLPGSLVSAIAERQEVERLASLPPASRHLPQSLHLAELATQALAEGRQAAVGELQQAASRYADLAPQDLDSILRHVEQAAAQLAAALDVSLSDAVDCEQLLAEADARREQLAPEVADAWQKAREETRLWQESELLSRRVDEFLSRENRRAAPAEVLPWKKQPDVAPTPHGVRSDTGLCAPADSEVLDQLGLLGQIDVAVSHCRQQRKAVSLAAVALDREDAFQAYVGAAGVRSALQLVMDTAHSLCDPEQVFAEIADTSLALVLLEHDRSQAVALARRLVATVSSLAAAPESWPYRPFTISAGVATLALPPRNFPPHELVQAAWRCLSASRSSGGNLVKSIDIY